MKVPDEIHEKLKARGLYAETYYHSTHVMPDGSYIVLTWDKVFGFQLPDWQDEILENEKSDIKLLPKGPHIILYFYENKWVVYSVHYAGGMGPGDFINEWNSIEEAYEDIIDYYFGYNDRMCLRRDSHRRGYSKHVVPTWFRKELEEAGLFVSKTFVLDHSSIMHAVFIATRKQEIQFDDNTETFDKPSLWIYFDWSDKKWIVKSYADKDHIRPGECITKLDRHRETYDDVRQFFYLSQAD